MRPLAIAHRAGNSLDALQAAVALGADVVEADVHGMPGRMEVRHLKTAGPLPVLWDRWELRRASDPRLLLPELLAAAGAGVTVLLDLKGRRTTAGRQLAALLHEHAPDQDVLVCSRYWAALDDLARLPRVRTVLSARNRWELRALRARLRRSTGDVGGVSVHRSLLTAGVVADLRAAVPLVTTWPVEDLGTLEQVLGLGVTGVTSASTAVLRAVVGTAAPPAG